MALLFVQYIEAALRHAHYEQLPDDGTIFGHIEGFAGVWANADTAVACRDELAEVLEGWVLLALTHGDVLPVVDGVDLNVRRTGAVSAMVDVR